MKLKNNAADFKNFVLEQLNSLLDVHCRPMFGGYGFYQDEVFFGIIHQGTLYFKTNAESRLEYESYGMCPFRPSETQTLKNYYEVPVAILENPEALSIWANRSIELTAESKNRKSKL